MKYPPCKICKHSKAKHGLQNVGKYVGWHKRRKIVELPVCWDCDSFLVLGPTYDWEYDIPTESVHPRHTYQADNLAFLELKSRSHEKKVKVTNNECA